MPIKERMKQVITEQTHDRTRYIQLREMTGISGDIWKNFWFDRRIPDADMLQALARAWPQYGYWLATGSTDVMNGHICPKSALCLEPETLPLLTAEAVLKSGVDAAIAFDEAVKGNEEEQSKAFDWIAKFLKGKIVHCFEPDEVGLYLPIDNLFKKIKAIRQAVDVRNKELEMRRQS